MLEQSRQGLLKQICCKDHVQCFPQKANCSVQTPIRLRMPDNGSSPDGMLAVCHIVLPEPNTHLCICWQMEFVEAAETLFLSRIHNVSCQPVKVSPLFIIGIAAAPHDWQACLKFWSSWNAGMLKPVMMPCNLLGCDALEPPSALCMALVCQCLQNA